MPYPARLVRVLAIALSLAPAVRAENAPPPGAPRCTLPGAGDWREYTSAHFVLVTDVSRDRGAALVQELEELHALVIAALFGEPVEVPGRTQVVAFARPGRFEEVAPEHASAYVTEGGYGEPTIVLPFEGREPAAEVVAHELAHDVSWHQFPRQPHWFTEGLAGFVMSVGARRQDTRAPELGSHLVRGDRQSGGRWAGFASPAVLALVKHTTTVGAKELLAWRGQIDGGDPARFHAASWLLYHWLWNTRSKPFTAFQERLANGEDPATAWKATFPEYDPDSADAMARLDRELTKYRHDAAYLPYRVEAGKVDASFTDRSLPTADVHMLLLLVRARWPSPDAKKAIRRAEVEEALREDPFQPAALAHRATDEKKSVADAVRPSTVAHPGDFRGWLGLAAALDDKADAAEKEAALRKAVALAPDSAYANNSLAWQLLTTGRAREARPFAERALDLAPWSGAIVDTLAAVAFAVGQCKPAVILQRRAADQYGDGRAGDEVRLRLAEYEARCGAAVAPAAPAK
jgi:tetratricopeptide (TPR) repeat protein